MRERARGADHLTEVADVVSALPYATAGGLFLMALVAGGSWMRHRDAIRGSLALAAALLAGVAALERLHEMTGYRHRLLEDLSILAFLASGFGLLLLRHRVMPLRRSTLVWTGLGLAALAGAAVLAQIPPSPRAELTTIQSLVAFALILAWTGCVLEPIVRFVRVSARRPAVQRARLRALSLGYGGLTLVLTIAFAGASFSEAPGFVLAVNIVALALLPLLQAAFVPPRWLRRLWRADEEGAMGRAMGHLLEVTPDSEAVAREAAAWASRLVGGDAAFLAAHTGEVLGVAGLEEGRAQQLASRFLDAVDPAVTPIEPRAGRFAISVPVGTGAHRGMLVVLSGPLTPLFGVDEISALERFATSVWAILDHARLVEALRRESTRYESLLQAVSDLGTGVVLVDGMSVAWANEAYVEITGYRLDELQAMTSLIEMASPEERDALMERGRLRRAGAPTEDHYETALIRKDGRRADVEVSIKPLSPDVSSRFITLVRDITARKRAEESLRHGYQRERQAAERLRSLDEMKNSFLMAVSHELRTPLTAILGFAQTLEFADERLDPEQRQTLLARLARNAVKLERLLADLLDLDRMRQHQLKPRMKQVDVGELAVRVIEETDGVRQRVEADIERTTATVDAAKVERIVENLLINAAKYTPDESPIIVRVRRENGGVLIAVDDSGPGVPADLHDSIFRPFEQGPAASPHAPGVGIGLSLVMQFAKLHGGRAWVENRDGGGASFRVWLPDGAAAGAPDDVSSATPAR